MAVTVALPGALVAYADGRRSVPLTGRCATVAQAFDQLWRLHPGLRDRVLTEQGQVRRHVNVFVGTDNIRDMGGLETPVPDGAEIAIVPAVSGGTG
jgi:molybdopterin converting factor small subunit